jgi:hypothetical protein
MKNVRAQLANSTLALVKARDIVRAKKKKLKKLKGNTLNAANAKLELKTIEMGVQAIEEQQELLVEQLKEKPLPARP